MFPAILAVDSIGLMPFPATVFTALGRAFAWLLHHGGGDDARRYGDDGVAQHHDDGGDELSRIGDWADVTIPHRGNGHNGPVDGSGDAVEAGVGGRFDNVHQRAKNANHQQHEEHKNVNLGTAGPQGRHQLVALVQKNVELENTEHPHQPQRPHDEQRMGSGYQKISVHRQDGQDVNQPEEASGITNGPVHTVEPQQVFDGKKNSNAPLQHEECIPPFGLQGRYGFQHQHHDAEEYHHQQHHVEELASRGFCLEDYFMQPLPEWAKIGWFPVLFFVIEIDAFHAFSESKLLANLC